MENSYRFLSAEESSKALDTDAKLGFDGIVYILQHANTIPLNPDGTIDLDVQREEDYDIALREAAEEILRVSGKKAQPDGSLIAKNYIDEDGAIVLKIRFNYDYEDDQKNHKTIKCIARGKFVTIGNRSAVFLVAMPNILAIEIEDGE